MRVGRGERREVKRKVIPFFKWKSIWKIIFLVNYRPRNIHSILFVRKGGGWKRREENGERERERDEREEKSHDDTLIFFSKYKFFIWKISKNESG